MGKKKRKTLPDNFEELLETRDIETLKKVFEICELNAYNKNNYCKPVAIAHYNCPDELARWLAQQGADIDIKNHYGRTPLHIRASKVNGNIKVLLELGADVSMQDDSLSGDSALHFASDAHNIENIKLLIDYGVDVNQKNSENMTPLEYALSRCSNSTLTYMVETSEILLKHGAVITENSRDLVKKIGETFEFYRSEFNKESLESADRALNKLYELFKVKPVPKRAMHDGESEIIIKEKTWQMKFNELWDMLVPPAGNANTMQGEVIRIAGRIVDEIERNAGANWDSEYKKMGKAYLNFLTRGEPLPESEIAKLESLLSRLENLYESSDDLAKYAVKWVEQNRTPIKFLTPNYNR